MLSVIHYVCAIILSVIMLNVVAPSQTHLFETRLIS